MLKKQKKNQAPQMPEKENNREISQKIAKDWLDATRLPTPSQDEVEEKHNKPDNEKKEPKKEN